MDGSEVSVTFEPQGRAVRVRTGATVREAAARAGIFLDYPCGGQGTCGKCRILIPGSAAELTSVERQLLAPGDLQKGVRLACQAQVAASCTITIPETSLLSSTYKILTDAGDHGEAADDPPIRKQFVDLPKPTLNDDCSDFERITRALGVSRARHRLLAALPRRLREGNFAGTAVVSDGTLIDFENGDTTGACCAAAFDIGTTTLVGVLLDMETGSEIARTSRMNPQTSFGDDVLTRILHTRQNPGGLSELRSTVVLAVQEMLKELVVEAGITMADVYEVLIAGNTTMQHLFTGLDPGALGEIPFVPAVGGSLRLSPEEAGLSIHPGGFVQAFPVIGGFVGGDTVAGMLATNIAESSGATMLIDIGTNGELVLHKDGDLWATSCAAGPAFEGARISHGMRAAAGAIEEVIFEDDLRVRVIGEAVPVGICGSALIDVAAGLLRLGVVLPQGFMLDADQAPGSLPSALRRRIESGPDGARFVLIDAAESATGSAIAVTQADIRELQLATAAIRAGFTILLRLAGLEPEELEHVLVAGAFGNYIRCEHAQRMGLLPHHVPRSRLAFVGNTSLAGARQAALSLGAQARAESLARRTKHVDLSLDPRFHEAYVEAMFFPDEEPTETSTAGHP